MTYPPLPEPTVIDGRRLFTAGDMRAYGLACADAQRSTPEPDDCTVTNTQPSPEVERLFGIFGMTS